MAIAAASCFSYSVLRGDVWKHARKMGATTRNASANTRKISAIPNHVTIGVLQEARGHETSVFGERALFGSLAEHSWPEQFLCDTSLLCNNGRSRISALRR